MTKQTTSKPPGETIQAIPGAMPLGATNFNNLSNSKKGIEVNERARFLVNDDLVEPPHIKAAREILKKNGGDWREASENEICDIIDQLPKPLFDENVWKKPENVWEKHEIVEYLNSKNLRKDSIQQDPEFAEIMDRIHQSEYNFYSPDDKSAGGSLLYMIRDARLNTDPDSFGQRLRQAGISISKVTGFTTEYTEAGLASKIRDQRQYFVEDLAKFLKEMKGSHGKLPHEIHEIPLPLKPDAYYTERGKEPPKEDDYINKGILTINKGTLVVDTTFNNTILELIQESGRKPGIIIKEFTFWRDGDDEDVESLKKASLGARSYKVTHWLTEHYDVYFRPRGSGFVTCNPTIYIRKGKPKPSDIKRSLSGMLSRPGSGEK